MTDLRALALAAMDEPDRDHPDFEWADAVDIPTAAEARYIKAASPDVVLALLDERDALILAIEAEARATRPDLTVERLAAALHATAWKNHPPAPMLRSICQGADKHIGQATAILAALGTPEEAPK